MFSFVAPEPRALWVNRDHIQIQRNE